MNNLNKRTVGRMSRTGVVQMHGVGTRPLSYRDLSTNHFGPVLQPKVVTISGGFFESKSARQVIVNSAERIRSGNPGVHGLTCLELTNNSTSLSSLGKNEPLYLVAHGSTTTLGQYSPKALAKRLNKLGLKDSTKFRGFIYLDGCQTGVPDSNGVTYAEKFARELSALIGPLNITVLGNRGNAATVRDGREYLTVTDSTTISAIKADSRYQTYVDNDLIVRTVTNGKEQLKGLAHNTLFWNVTNLNQYSRVVDGDIELAEL